ncbi:MAG: 6-phosphogluconolactonase [Chlorobium sp.]|nr:MAG: 6-phosphogluconolactonase [Chlorobium sp.]
MSTAERKFLYSGSEKEITEHAAALIITEAHRAVKDHGQFSLVLAGGKSPRQLYRHVAQGVTKDIFERYGLWASVENSVNQEGETVSMPWAETWLFWGDERRVPIAHPDSNYRMAVESLLEHAPLPENHIFRMPAEKEDSEKAAREYEETISAFFRATYPYCLQDFPMFDFIILGLGEDGHTASLFANNADVLKKQQRWVLAVDEPRANPPGKRLTLSLPVINHARNVLFYTTGKEKSRLAEKIFLNKERLLPASLVRPEKGMTFWFTAQL